MTERQIGNLALACHEIDRAYKDLMGDQSIIEWDVLPVYQQIGMVKKVQKMLETLDQSLPGENILYRAIVRATVRINKR